MGKVGAAESGGGAVYQPVTVRLPSALAESQFFSRIGLSPLIGLDAERQRDLLSVDIPVFE
jgi:hypothetical protein